MPKREGYGKLPASRVVSTAPSMDVGCRGWKLGRDAKCALVGRPRSRLLSETQKQLTLRIGFGLLLLLVTAGKYTRC